MDSACKRNQMIEARAHKARLRAIEKKIAQKKREIKSREMIRAIVFGVPALYIAVVTFVASAYALQLIKYG